MAKEKGIWVFIEQKESIARDISWELLGKSRELADEAKEELIAFVFGHNVKPIAQEAIHRGADKAYFVDDPLLDHYKWETYSKVAEKILIEYKPNMLIVGATPNGRDLAGRLAVRLNTGLTADVVRLEVKGNLLLGQVPGFGGSILAVIKCETARPQMATVRPGIFIAIEPDINREGEVIEVKSNITKADVSTQLIKDIKVEGIDISKAKRIVAGGRGLGADMSGLKELAQILDAEIGVTRPLCDVGYFPRDHQVGSTGVTVRPEITINLGISGAAHYTAGISDSNTVISINTDPEATIFEYTDYKVHADLNDILPLLIDKLKAKLKGRMKEVTQ
jgi:electron transfer flavoprotein alpha subunit